MTGAEQQVDEPPAPRARPRRPRLPRTPAAHRGLLLPAALALLGAVLAVLVPFLPVRQTTAVLDWPQQGRFADVTAPLVAYTPVELRASLDCGVVRSLGDDAVVLATAPTDAPDARGTSLQAVTSGGVLTVFVRGVPTVVVPVADLVGDGCALVVTSLPGSTEVSAAGRDVVLAGDVRPQVVGVSSDLRGDAVAGVSLRAVVDTRYDTRPTTLKLAVSVLALLGLATGLVLASRTDRRTAHASPARTRRPLRARLRPGWSDGAVLGALLVWWVVGSTTSDDGYLLTMARASQSSGYIGNYFRWFNSPEAPFGWYYELFGVMVKLSSSALWMRVPALVMGVLTWLVVSRAVLPRLGAAVHLGPARWSAAAVLLAFWLPFDAGLRPETPIALGIVVTWVLVEHAVASARVLPLAGALLAAAFSLAAGPTGLAAVAVLLVAARPLTRVLLHRAREVGPLPALAPLAAAGTAVLVVVFADQSAAAVREATRVRTSLGPSLPWYKEPQRYTSLLLDVPDGGLARRFPVLLMFVLVAVCVVVVLRRGGIPGTAHPAVVRLVGSTAVGIASMVLTPTKWTHHFGAFAGIVAAVAAVATVAIGAEVLRSRRNRAAVTAGLLVVVAFALTGPNNWWYVSAWGVPFTTRAPQVGGVQLATLVLVGAGVSAAVAVREHLRFSTPQPSRRRLPPRLAGVVGAPVTVAALLVVAGLLGSFLVSTATRWPAYTIGEQNIRSATGGSCGLGDAVQVEQPAFGGALTAADPGSDPLTAPAGSGFTRDGVPPSLLSGASAQTGGGAAIAADATQRGGGDTGTGTSFSAPLPAGLDPATTTVLGSYDPSATTPAQLVTGWFALPAATPQTPLLAVTAAGYIAAIDPDGQQQPGQQLDVELGTGPAGAITSTGTRRMLDPTGGPSWRTLRLPRDQVPDGTTWVRLVASDFNPLPDGYVAFTAPRVPTLAPLAQVLPASAPVLMDWVVGLSYPCLRPFDVADGVAEAPVARLTPGERGLPLDVVWETAPGGGPLGWTGLVSRGEVLTSYLSGDWGREWGSVIIYQPYQADAVPAQLQLGEETRSGYAPQAAQWLPPSTQRDES